MAGELKGITQQVGESDPHEIRIGIGNETLGDADIEVAIGLLFAQFGNDLSGQGTEIRRAGAQFTVGDPGQVEHVVDQPPHADGVGPDPFDGESAGVVQ